MPGGTARRLRRLTLLLGCVAAGLVVPASANAISSAACMNRVNNTPGKLIPCIKEGDLWAHMEKFQAIANANPGADGHPSRNSGEPGYKASVNYVANVMRAAGYNVRIQTYRFDYFAFTSLPQFSEVSPTPQTFGLTTDWNPGRANGSVSNAAVQPVGGIVIPPTPTSSSASGCSSADFSGFVAGRVALIQRGTCTFGTKVQNAEAAGASGVIIFNEGNPGRTAVFNGTLTDAAGNPVVPTVPVAFTTFAVGQSLYNQYQSTAGSTPAVISLNVSAIENPNAEDYNVIAESKGGNPNSVLVVDAHLDAIYGAGMLDNASGSATILDIAQMMRKVNPLHKLRFIWFGGEELGLFGSTYYVNELKPTALSHIAYDLDSDVTATPNYVIGILDPRAVDFFGRTVSTEFPKNVYEPSEISRNQSIAYFNSIGKHHELFSPVGTDAFNFNKAGIPASGMLTGQDCCKTPEEVELFGGSLGNYDGNIPSFDGGCVDNPFRWCDNLSNNNPEVLTFMSKAFANTTVRMAFNKDIGGATGPAVVHRQVLRHANIKPLRAVAAGEGRYPAR
jgi:Peptidase family M28/PA domain